MKQYRTIEQMCSDAYYFKGNVLLRNVTSNSIVIHLTHLIFILSLILFYVIYNIYIHIKAFSWMMENNQNVYIPRHYISVK